MFKKLSEKPVAEVQKEQVAKWKEEDLLHKCVTAREGAPSFVFYEGPPTANGKPGIHHVMARTLKDSINRYKTMQGYQVKRKGGWDTMIISNFSPDKLLIIMVFSVFVFLITENAIFFSCVFLHFLFSNLFFVL